MLLPFDGMPCERTLDASSALCIPQDCSVLGWFTGAWENLICLATRFLNSWQIAPLDALTG